MEREVNFFFSLLSSHIFPRFLGTYGPGTHHPHLSFEGVDIEKAKLKSIVFDFKIAFLYPFLHSTLNLTLKAKDREKLSILN
jgi:hypothetical protein